MTNRTVPPLLKPALFAALFLFSLAPLRAQNRQYVTEQRFIQRLVWIGDEYAFRYEVVVERNEGKGYREYRREFTELPGLQISLPLGNYRYRVIPYDFLDQPGEASDWVALEVLAPPTAPGEEPEPPAPAVSEKQIDTILGAAWAPSFPLYGRMREIFGNELHSAGASVRFGLLYNKPRWFSPGIELSASWYALDSAQSGDEIGVQTGVTGFNLVAQKQFLNKKLAVTLRAGGAVAFQVGEISVEQYSYTTGGLIPQINVEASFLWFAYKEFYLEASLGFTHLLDKGGNSGCLRPRLGMGWQI